MAANDLDRARRMADNVIRDAAEQQSFQPFAAVRAKDDGVRRPFGRHLEDGVSHVSFEDRAGGVEMCRPQPRDCARHELAAFLADVLLSRKDAGGRGWTFGKGMRVRKIARPFHDVNDPDGRILRPEAVADGIDRRVGARRTIDGKKDVHLPPGALPDRAIDVPAKVQYGE